jgi:hypothetical protein
MDSLTLLAGAFVLKAAFDTDARLHPGVWLCAAALDPVSASASARVAFTHKLGEGVEAVEIEALNQRAWERMYASLSNSIIPAAARSRRHAQGVAFNTAYAGGACTTQPTCRQSVHCRHYHAHQHAPATIHFFALADYPGNPTCFVIHDAFCRVSHSDCLPVCLCTNEPVPSVQSSQPNPGARVGFAHGFASTDEESLGAVPYFRPRLCCSDITIEAMAGELHVNAMRIRALSREPTARLVDATAVTGSGIWYFEVLLLSEGHIHLGWASVGFHPDQSQVRQTCTATHRHTRAPRAQINTLAHTQTHPAPMHARPR